MPTPTDWADELATIFVVHATTHANPFDTVAKEIARKLREIATNGGAQFTVRCQSCGSFILNMKRDDIGHVAPPRQS